MFYIKNKGKTIELDGEEEYFFKCSGCGKSEFMSDGEFFDWCKEPGIYEISSIYCSDTCSKRSRLTVVN